MDYFNFIFKLSNLDKNNVDQTIIKAENIKFKKSFECQYLKQMKTVEFMFIRFKRKLFMQ